MIYIVIALVLFLISKGSGVVAVGSVQPTSNTTGAALGTALGTSNNPPSYYSSGNPGYSTGPTATVAPVVTLPSPAAQVSPGVQTGVNATPTQAATVARSGVANPSAPLIVQPVAIRTRISSPETASTFFTRTPYPVYTGRVAARNIY